MSKPIWLALQHTLGPVLAFLFPPTGRRRRAGTPVPPLAPSAPTRTVTGLALIVRLIDPPGAADGHRFEPPYPEPRPAPPGPAPFVRPYLVAYEQELLREAVAA